MCGRYTRQYTWRQVEAFLDLQFPVEAELRPSYNVAPTQEAPIVRESDRGRELAWATWGLAPSWARDPKAGARMINARAETVASKPAYAKAYRSRRCVVPASGFYEWQATGTGTKQPYHISRADGRIMCIAGIWERWDTGDGPLDTYAVVTTAPNAEMRPVHSRMPLILEQSEVTTWLSTASATEVADALLRTPPDGITIRTPVSRRVGNVRQNDPALLDPVGDAPGLFD